MFKYNLDEYILSVLQYVQFYGEVNVDDLRELGYTWNEADTLRQLCLVFKDKEYVSGTVNNLGGK